MLDDALDARAREHGRLDADLAGMALVRAPADARVLALGVLAHEHHVDVAGRAARKCARHALEQPHGTDVGPQVEALADRQQQPPERDVVGDVGPPDGAEQDRIECEQALDRVRRHHHAVLDPVVGTPVEVAPLDLELQLVDAPARLVDDFGPTPSPARTAMR